MCAILTLSQTYECEVHKVYFTFPFYCISNQVGSCSNSNKTEVFSHSPLGCLAAKAEQGCCPGIIMRHNCLSVLLFAGLGFCEHIAWRPLKKGKWSSHGMLCKPGGQIALCSPDCRGRKANPSHGQAWTLEANKHWSRHSGKRDNCFMQFSNLPPAVTNIWCFHKGVSLDSAGSEMFRTDWLGGGERGGVGSALALQWSVYSLMREIQLPLSYHAALQLWLAVNVQYSFLNSIFSIEFHDPRQQWVNR